MAVTPAPNGTISLGACRMLAHAEPVHRARPAEGEEWQAARVLAALDGVHAGRAGHAFVDQLMDAPRRARGVHAQRIADARLHRVFGAGQVEAQPTAQEKGRIEIAEQQIGVGDGLFGCMPPRP